MAEQDPDVSQMLNAANITRCYGSSTSAENPLLNLEPNEYFAIKKFNQSKVPERFKNSLIANSSAQENAILAPHKPEVINPIFKTTASEYGKYRPNEHTSPLAYHGLNTRFTNKEKQELKFNSESKIGFRVKKILDSIEAGDVIPEAEIVANIVDKLEKNLLIASVISYFCEKKQENPEHVLSNEGLDNNMKLQKALFVLQNLYSNLEERYKENAEFEAQRAGHQDGRASPVEKPDKLAVKQQIQRLNEISKLEEKFQYMSRDTIFLIAQDLFGGGGIKEYLETADKNQQVEDFYDKFREFKDHARPLVLKTRSTTAKEYQILLSKVRSYEQNKLIRDELQQDLNAVYKSREEILGDRRKEADELRLRIQQCKDGALVRIQEVQKLTAIRIKKVQEESESKQAEFKERIQTLNKQKQDQCVIHWEAERERRHTNKELEARVFALIQKYDQEMFDYHERIHKEEEEYNQAFEKLQYVEHQLELLEVQRDEILEQKKQEEIAERNAKMEEIQKRRAAITIQRGWRDMKAKLAAAKRKKSKMKRK